MADLELQRKTQSEPGSRDVKSGQGKLLPDNRAAENKPLFQISPPLQRKGKVLTDNRAAQNKTGLPAQLKAGIEALSGMNMDHVRVNFNSQKPTQLNAHAYAQGSDIHIAPGQEQHLPHEAWHVVPQAQGRVKPTLQMKNAIAINGNQGLENEADQMGEKASTLLSQSTASSGLSQTHNPYQLHSMQANPPIVQCVSFTNASGKKVVVPDGELLKGVNRWFIKTIREDNTTPIPLRTEKNQDGILNWDEEHTKGGEIRKAQNINDYYNITKEAKTTPGYTLALDHDIDGKESQFASSTLKTSDRTKGEGIDGMIFPSDKIDKEVKGKGVAYKELAESFGKLSDKDDRGDKEVALAHLSLLQGEDAIGFNNDEIAKMYYHLSVLQNAEARRNAAMFMYGPIALQNIADGELTASDAFQPLEEEGDEEDGKKKKKKKEKISDIPETRFPAAWSGSKSGLEIMEAYDDEESADYDKSSKLNENAKAVKKQMQWHLNAFFNGRTDFSSDVFKNIPGADFTDKEGAIEAAINLIRKKYFSTIPALGLDQGEGTEWDKNKKENLKQGNVRDTVHEVHTVVGKMEDGESIKKFKDLTEETAEDALLLTDKDASKQKRAKFAQKLSSTTKKNTREEEDFSGDDSEGDYERRIESSQKFRRSVKPKINPGEWKEIRKHSTEVMTGLESFVAENPDLLPSNSEEKKLLLGQLKKVFRNYKKSAQEKNPQTLLEKRKKYLTSHSDSEEDEGGSLSEESEKLRKKKVKKKKRNLESDTEILSKHSAKEEKMRDEDEDEDDEDEDEDELNFI